jgi:hypothetical protein
MMVGHLLGKIKRREGYQMLLIELNEFNSELLQNLAEARRLKSVQEMLSWNHATTRTSDEYETGFLEPWVQWVSVHTGVPSSQHGVKNLGDVPNLAEDQIWERWSKRGLSSIVWGVMNGDRRQAENCEIFIPDPWTFSEGAYPSKFQGLIALPRYLARNYLDFSKLTALRKGFGLLHTLLRSMKFADFIDGLRILRRGIAQFGTTNVVFIVYFEYLSAMAFIRAVEQNRPNAAIIFINMLAHVQHHYWKARDGSACPQIAFAASVIDEILEKILARCKNPSGGGDVAVMNALSQNCTVDEAPWILYRPNNHSNLIDFLGLKAIRVEPLMTYDAHVFFKTVDDARKGAEILERTQINGKPLFFVEPDKHNLLKLFYRVEMHDPVSADAEFACKKKAARFADHFTAIVQRTGKHNQNGDLYANFEIGRREFLNYELSNWLEASSLQRASA